MKTSAENISNSILQSIDIVLQERIKELAFDKTLICTIIDDRDKKNGKYQVTDGSIKFWAYSSVDTYSKDEQVRVSVANGDMTQDKYIIGKYIANNDVKPISFVSPLEKVLDISDNLLAGLTSPEPYGLAANGLVMQDKTLVSTIGNAIVANGIEYLPIASVNLTNQHKEYVSLQQNKIYDTLYMQADFKSLLKSDIISTGTFGLLVILSLQGQDGSSSSHSVVFDSSKMYGNPYNFALYSRQQAKFDIASLDTIIGVHVFFFQANDFTNYKGEHIVPSYANKEQTELIKTLLATDIIVGFGADLDKYADNTLQLYSNQDTYYTNELAASRTRELALAWYNKTADNKYLGFSDGVVDPKYDERTYIQQTTRYHTLRAQMSNDVHNSEEGLDLSYDAKTVKPMLENIGSIVQKELCPALTSFAEQAIQIPEAAAILTEEGLIVQIDRAGAAFKKKAKELYDYYFSVLKWASQVNPKSETISSQTSTIEIDRSNQPTKLAYTTILQELFNNFKTLIINNNDIILPTVADALKKENTPYKEFQSVYDAKIPRIKEIYNKINAIWVKVLAFLESCTDNTSNNDIALERLIDNPTIYPPFTQVMDENQTPNRYAIYWYHKDETAKADDLMPAGWRLMDVAPSEYLPEADPEKSTYLQKSTDKVVTVELDPNKKSETFKVILFYNHERFESNELVFTNTSELENKENLKYANALSIRHGDKSRDVYQEYGMSNSLMNIADRYKKRMLSVDFALSDGAVDNLQLVGTQIFWYVPNRATMLTYDLEDIENLSKETIDSEAVNPFINDLPVDDKDPVHSEHYRDGYTCFYKTICKGMRLPNKELAETDPQAYESQLAAVTVALKKDIQFCYRIRDYYVPSFSNNMICCKVIKDDITYEAEISFAFASYGTSGTDYTLVITPAGRQAAVTDHDNLLLDVMLFNGDNEQIAFQREGEQYVIQDPPSDIKIEYKDNNKIAQYTISASDNCHQGILAVQVKVPYSKNKNGEAVITAYYPIAWSTNKDYYMEGGSMVVYNSQGVNPSYYKDPYRLFTQAYKDTISTGDWGVHHWDGSNSVDPNNYSKDDYKDYQVDFNFLPVMQSNKLIPSNMYIDFTDEQKVWTPYVCCTDWYQPILIIQNKYGLPMLNNWDGSLQIDEKNGTILASMIGAGRKTENNTFEGVLMGDVQKAEGDQENKEFNYDNKTGLGIYGFNDGAQSFGFNVDGTAFIGKSGRGRILFDGNSGQISSASYQATRLLDGKPDQQPTKDTDLISGFTQGAGMMIDLDDGVIDIRGTAIEEKDQIDETTGEVIKKAPYYVVEDLNKVKQEPKPNPDDSPEDPNIGEIKVERDENNNPIVPQQSHIRIDARSPYFTITSIQGKDLVSIGNKGYFIQSDNYVPFEFKETVEKQEEEVTDGYGMKIDLHQGSIDAYNLKITSKTFFVNSRKDATANFIVRDPSTNKNIIHMGILKPNEEGNYPTEVDKIKNIWYLQSGNYTIAEFDENNKLKENTGTGMKIDLGTGQIDAYNFKLTSKNVLIDSTKDAKVYFEIKAQNTVANALQTIFQVNDKGATLAGWTVDKNSIRIGTLGVGPKDMTDTSTEHSMWLCSTGTGSQTPSEFVGGAASGWCLTIGRNFGVNKAGEMFGRGVTIKDGDISIYQHTTDDQGNVTVSAEPVFQATRDGTVTARNVQIFGGSLRLGEDLNNPTFLVSKTGEMIAKSGTFGPWSISSTQVLPGAMTSVGYISAADKDQGVSLYVDGVIYNFYTDDNKGASSVATWKEIVQTAHSLHSNKLNSVVSSEVFYVDDVALGKRYKCQYESGVLVLLETIQTNYELVTKEYLKSNYLSSSSFDWSNKTIVTGVDFEKQTVTTETLYYWG